MYSAPFSATIKPVGAPRPKGGEKTKKNISIALLAAAMLLWILRKMNVLYIPGLSMFLLAVSMLIVAVMMFQLKQKKKAGGTLLFAFGLFCIVAGIMEIKGYMA